MKAFFLLAEYFLLREQILYWSTPLHPYWGKIVGQNGSNLHKRHCDHSNHSPGLDTAKCKQMGNGLKHLGIPTSGCTWCDIAGAEDAAQLQFKTLATGNTNMLLFMDSWDKTTLGLNI